MKLKSLLLGSAAALVAVSGARAADAVIIPEPEVVEYVRVCDAAGTGYFYIPGTETCLKISGYVQTDINFMDGQEGWNNDWEARLLFESWTDTEYGPLATVIRTTAGNISHDEWQAGVTTSTPFNLTSTFSYGAPFNDLTVDRAYFDLAGLRVGLDASAYDFGISGETDSFGNGRETGVIRYTASVGATSIFVSLEGDSNLTSGGFASPQHNWMPNIVVGASGSMGEASYTVAFAYDESSIRSASPIGEVWSAKGVVSFMNFNVGVQYSSDADPTGFGTEAFSGPGEWYVAASYDFEASDKLTITPAAEYASDTNFGAAGTPNMWGVGVTAKYDITDTLFVQGDITYNDTSTTTGTWAGKMRFRASF